MADNYNENNGYDELMDDNTAIYKERKRKIRH